MRSGSGGFTLRRSSLAGSRKYKRRGAQTGEPGARRAIFAVTFEAPGAGTRSGYAERVRGEGIWPQRRRRGALVPLSPLGRGQGEGAGLAGIWLERIPMVVRREIGPSPQPSPRSSKLRPSMAAPRVPRRGEGHGRLRCRGAKAVPSPLWGEGRVRGGACGNLAGEDSDGGSARDWPLTPTLSPLLKTAAIHGRSPRAPEGRGSWKAAVSRSESCSLSPLGRGQGEGRGLRESGWRGFRWWFGARLAPHPNPLPGGERGQTRRRPEGSVAFTS